MGENAVHQFLNGVTLDAELVRDLAQPNRAFLVGHLGQAFLRVLGHRDSNSGAVFNLDGDLRRRGVSGANSGLPAVSAVFSQVPVHQWVLSFPKRLRYFLARDADLLDRVLKIFLNRVEKALRLCS